MMTNRPSAFRYLFPSLATCAVLLASAAAGAQGIKSPGDHPPYDVEVEPHLLLEFLDDDDFGIGARATFKLMDPGFVDSINNTAGIGVGLDYIDLDDRCFGRRGDDRFCYDRDLINIPIVAHWSFWFGRSWSAFAEAGIALQFYMDDDDDDFDDDDDDNFDLDPAFFLGGRYNFSDAIALTLRLGTHANFSIGASFFL